MQSWPCMLVSLLFESMWGDIQASKQCLTDRYEFLLKLLFMEQAWECYFWGTLTVLSLSECLSNSPLCLEHNLDCKDTKSKKARLKLTRISMLHPRKLGVQLSICSFSCLASSVDGPWRGLERLENWIRSIVTRCPLGCVSEAVRVLLCCGPHGHMACRHARARTGLMNATQTQTGPGTVEGAEGRLQHNNWLIHSTVTHSFHHVDIYCSMSCNGLFSMMNIF